MQLTIDVIDSEVTVTCVVAGVDHSGSGRDLDEALTRWAEGMRYIASKWGSVFTAKSTVTAAERRRADDLMAAIAAAPTPTHLRSLLFVSFQLQHMLRPAPVAPHSTTSTPQPDSPTAPGSQPR